MYILENWQRTWT